MTAMDRAELIARLDAAADRLTTRVLAEMYADPFWYARFGERADRHGRQDGRFHIDYLIQAVQAGDPGIMAHYARWLQQVLTSRGMATHHLAENFARLGDAIRDEGWPDGGEAIAMLDAARAALVYPAGPARDVQQAAAALGAAAAGGAALAGRIADLVDHAADAIALGQPELFVHHVAWLADFQAGRGAPRGRLVADLAALAAAAPRIFAEPAAAIALATVLGPAQAALVAVDIVDAGSDKQSP